MRTIATGRLVGLLLALIASGLSIQCVRDALRRNAEFHQWLDARPMETDIDLSQTREITVAFHQTCSMSHGEALFLRCDLDDKSEPKPEELFKELSEHVVIKNSAGQEIETVEINNKTAGYWNGEIVLAMMTSFQNGDYSATIRIDSAVPAFADKQQTIYAKYQLCGLEQMPAVIASAFAVVAGVIGLVATICVTPGLLRRGIWRDVPKISD